MEKSELRDSVEKTIDKVEDAVRAILEDLRMVEDTANMDYEEMDVDDVASLSLAVTDTIVSLKELADSLQ